MRLLSETHTDVLSWMQLHLRKCGDTMTIPELAITFGTHTEHMEAVIATLHEEGYLPLEESISVYRDWGDRVLPPPFINDAPHSLPYRGEVC